MDDDAKVMHIPTIEQDTTGLHLLIDVTKFSKLGKLLGRYCLYA